MEFPYVWSVNGPIIPASTFDAAFSRNQSRVRFWPCVQPHRSCSNVQSKPGTVCIAADRIGREWEDSVPKKKK